jgi:hypothetical protein
MLALVNFLTDQDLVNLIDNKELLDATRQAAQSELSKRNENKIKANDL